MLISCEYVFFLTSVQLYSLMRTHLQHNGLCMQRFLCVCAPSSCLWLAVLDLSGWRQCDRLRDRTGETWQSKGGHPVHACHSQWSHSEISAGKIVWSPLHWPENLDEDDKNYVLRLLISCNNSVCDFCPPFCLECLCCIWLICTSFCYYFVFSLRTVKNWSLCSVWGLSRANLCPCSVRGLISVCLPVCLSVLSVPVDGNGDEIEGVWLSRTIYLSHCLSISPW